jgi:hypothetical protein
VDQMSLRSTGNFVVNHLKLFVCNKIYIEPCQSNYFRYFKPQFQPQFRFPSLNSILYCYSNMGRHYIHEYLTPSDSKGLNHMNIMPTHI